MALRTKWITVDVDKLDQIFTVMDKINVAAVRGLIDQAGKDLLIGSLRNEIPYTIIPEESESKQKPAAEPAASEPAKSNADKSTKKQ